MLYKTFEHAKISEQYKKRIHKTLQELIFFILEIDDPTEKDAVEIDGIPNEKR